MMKLTREFVELSNDVEVEIDYILDEMTLSESDSVHSISIKIAELEKLISLVRNSKHQNELHEETEREKNDLFLNKLKDKWEKI